MFLMSNWALVRMIRDAWFKHGTFALTADPVPYVCVILIVLGVLMAGETIIVLSIHKPGSQERVTQLIPADQPAD